MIKSSPNVRSDTVKLLQENIGEILDLGYTKNFRHDTKSMSCKRKNKVDFIKVLKFFSEKKRHPREWNLSQ